jgi:hypothetical protein
MSTVPSLESRVSPLASSAFCAPASSSQGRQHQSGLENTFVEVAQRHPRFTSLQKPQSD